jgi:quercetin dioxygenase-like cupin family protein
MTFVRHDESVRFEMHGGVFNSFVRPAAGATQLCAWRIDLPAGLEGTAHQISHEEVFLVLEGTLSIEVDGVRAELAVGDVAHVPAGSSLRLDAGAAGGTAWVTCPVGLTATLPGGATVAPPWTV